MILISIRGRSNVFWTPPPHESHGLELQIQKVKTSRYALRGPAAALSCHPIGGLRLLLAALQKHFRVEGSRAGFEGV